MRDFHGIIFAYNASPSLGRLVADRTAASLPFCGRYRLIDFALSSLRNAGVLDVGVIMQRDYQSLLDHIGSGKTWDMSRKSGGLRMLPPFGLPGYHRGNYTGAMEALNAVSTYIHDIKQSNVILLQGSVCANYDLEDVIKQHIAKNADVTVICADHELTGNHHRFVIGEDGFVDKLYFERTGGEGLPSLEGFIIRKEVLINMMDKCKSANEYRFHRDALMHYLAEGGRVNAYVHKGYASVIRTINDYFNVSMDMLEKKNIFQIFPPERPVRTKHLEGVSSYYGEHAYSKNCLVADNCIIDGNIENCIVFSGARIAKGANLKNCIVMQNCAVESGCNLNYVIADKSVTFTDGITLTGSLSLPVVVPKGITV